MNIIYNELPSNQWQMTEVYKAYSGDDGDIIDDENITITERGHRLSQWSFVANAIIKRKEG